MTIMDLYEQGLKYLAIREHSRFELKQKLFKKCEDMASVEEVLNRLERENALSDKRFCESFLRSRLRKGIEGKNILAMRLKTKGIDKTLATIEVNRFFEEYDDAIDKAIKNQYEKVLRLKGEEKAKKMLYQKGLASFTCEYYD